MIQPFPIRRVIDLLQLCSEGGRLIRREKWQLSEANGWRLYELRMGSLIWRVDPRIAIAADRKGLVRVERETA